MTGQIFASAAPDPLPEEGDQTSGIRILPPPPSPPHPPPLIHHSPVPKSSPPIIEGLYYTSSTIVSVPSFELGPPTPSTASECVPPGTKVGGQHWSAGKGMGGPNSDDWRESLALCVLCASPRILFPFSILIVCIFPTLLQFIAALPPPPHAHRHYFVSFLSIFIFRLAMLYIRANSSPPSPRASRDMHDILII